MAEIKAKFLISPSTRKLYSRSFEKDAQDFGRRLPRKGCALTPCKCINKGQPEKIRLAFSFCRARNLSLPLAFC
jgi:hypothetical protein